MRVDAEMLLSLMRRLGAAETVEQLLNTALGGALELVGADRGFLMERSGRGRMRVRAARNISQDRVLTDAFRPFRKVAEGVAVHGEPFVSADARADLGLVAAARGDLRADAVIVVPWRVSGRVAGALFVDRQHAHDQPFSDDDVRILQTVADLVARLADLSEREGELAAEARALREARDLLERSNTSLQEDMAAKSVELATAERALATSHLALSRQYTFQNIVARSPQMLAVFDLINQVVDYAVPVLITGESGTGKELIARALHFGGARAQLPFLAINCAAIPENLLESELFGYVRGAFTGATTDKDGLFRAAGRGTVFLDEIGEMPLATQVKLLRVLQEREIRRIGGRDAEPFEARILAATNRELLEEVQRRRFREDLYYRLNVVQVHVPPLAERIEDVPALVNHFVEKFTAEFDLPAKRVDPEAMQRLMAHTWPGNIRQLENAVKSSVILTRGEVIRPHDLRLPDAPPDAPPPASPTPREAPRPAIATRADWEAHDRDRIVRALVDSGWNKSEAATALGISRRNLYRKLARYGIEGAASAP